MACDMMSAPPSEVLSLNDEERQFAVALAQEVEKWRFEQFSKLFGGR